MDKAKRRRLEEAGWKVGSVSEFLDLSADEAAYLELKFELARSLQKKRQEQKMTQMELARLIKSSQSRVAKMEAGDASVSLDMLIRSLLALGTAPKAVLRLLPQ